MKNIPVNPAEILTYEIDRQDEKTIIGNYVKWLLMYLFLVVCCVFPMMVERDDALVTFPKLAFCIFTLTFGGCFIHYGRTIYSGRTRYRKDIEKYGAQVLTNDLLKPDNDVFYLNGKKHETYVIISDAFLYLSHTRIFPLSEILTVNINPADAPLATTPLIDFSFDKPYNPNSKNPREMARFMKRATIEFRNGRKEKCLLALEEYQLRELFQVLNQRLQGVK